jgi:hypothetical protein
VEWDASIAPKHVVEVRDARWTIELREAHDMLCLFAPWPARGSGRDHAGSDAR